MPYAQVGADSNPIHIINGGQGFMMNPDQARLAKDAQRVGRIRPDGRRFIVVGYDPTPPDVTGAIAADVGSIIDRHFSG